MPQKLTHSQSYSVRPKKEIKNDSFDESSYFSMIKLDLKRITSRIIIREKHIQKTQFIRAPADVVISTVSNVESYSSFVPFCKKSSFDKISGIGTLQEWIKKYFMVFGKKLEKNFFIDHLKKVGFGPIKQSWKSQVEIHENIIRATNEGEYPLTKLNTGLKVCSAQLPLTHCPLSVFLPCPHKFLRPIVMDSEKYAIRYSVFCLVGMIVLPVCIYRCHSNTINCFISISYALSVKWIHR